MPVQIRRWSNSKIYAQNAEELVKNSSNSPVDNLIGILIVCRCWLLNVRLELLAASQKKNR